jgi:CHAD domain-containing protein
MRAPAEMRMGRWGNLEGCLGTPTVRQAFEPAERPAGSKACPTGQNVTSRFLRRFFIFHTRQSLGRIQRSEQWNRDALGSAAKRPLAASIMAGGKWIGDLTAETPVADAARRALTVRLEVVRDYLPLALHDAENDPEHVHQLRVGTRRARAALDIFAQCLPPKALKSAKKLLRGLRRAAGEARDWDVFVAGLVTWEGRRGTREKPGLDYLIGYASALRTAAQTHLEEAAADYPFSFDRFLAETVAAVHRPPAGGPRTLADLARPLLSGLLHELEEAASGDLTDYAHLHRVRILGKRLRYAMEVFADCFAAPFREQFYPAVEQMQEILGNANDSHVASQRLEALRARLQVVLPEEWKRYRPGIEKLLRHHLERLPRERARFEEWWCRWEKSGAESAFAALLKIPASPAV